MLKRIKQPLQTVLVGLTLLELFALFKPAVLFPGLASRTLWVLFPVAILTVLACIDFQKLLKNKNQWGHFARICRTGVRSKATKSVIEYLFAVLLIISLLSSSGIRFLNPLNALLKEYSTLIFCIGFCLGASIIHLNRNRYAFTESHRTTQAQKNRWIALLFLLLLATALYTYNLGAFDFKEDEFQVVDAAAGYQHTGTFYKWDWIENESGEVTGCEGWSAYCHYTRAWPHSWIIAQSYKLFGTSEWSSRIVSVVFGLLAVVLFYFITLFFTESEMISFFGTLSFICYSAFINLFRYTRMYALLIPLTMLLVYFLYRGLTEHNQNLKNKFLKRYFNFNYTHILVAGVVTLIGTLIHINILVILPSTFLFVLYLAWEKKEARYKLSSTIGGLGILFVLVLSLFTDLFSKIASFLSFFGKNNVVYFAYAAKFPLTASMGLALLALSVVFWWVIKNEGLKKKITYLIITVGFSLVFFAFIADRYASFSYISHVVPFALILILFSLWAFLGVYNDKKSYIRYAIIIVFLVSLCSTVITQSDYLYNAESSHGKFSAAYPTLIEKYQPDETIFAQYLRRYYAQDLAPGTTIVNMRNNQQYHVEEFYTDMLKAKKGWVVWETRKSYHLDPRVISLIDSEFEKLHGTGIDDTNIEMYRFTEEDVNRLSQYMTSFSENGTYLE